MFYTYELISKLVSDLYNWMQTNPSNLEEVEKIFESCMKEINKYSKFELHFLPHENQKYKITMVKSNNSPILKLKQKNNKSNKETEYEINMEKDAQNIPSEIKTYINGFNKLESELIDKINSRFQKISCNNCDDIGLAKIVEEIFKFEQIN